MRNQTISHSSNEKKSETKSRGETQVARASEDERKENVSRRSLAFSVTHFWTPLFVSDLYHRFSSKGVGQEATKNLTNETYLNGVDDTLTFLSQTTPLSPTHGLMLQQNNEHGLIARNITENN